MYKQGTNLSITKRKMMAEFHRSLKHLKKHQEKLVKFVTGVYDNARVCYIPIAPRRWWGYPARCLAGFLDYNFFKRVAKRSKVLEVRDLYEENKTTYQESCNFSDNILDGYLDYDKIHLNDLGFQLMMTKVTVPLSINHYQRPYGPGAQQHQ